MRGSDLRIRVNFHIEMWRTRPKAPRSDADHVSTVEPDDRPANNPPSRRRGTASEAPPRLTLPRWLPLGVVRGEQVPESAARAVLKTAPRLLQLFVVPRQTLILAPKRSRCPEPFDERSAWTSPTAGALPCPVTLALSLGREK